MTKKKPERKYFGLVLTQKNDRLKSLDFYLPLTKAERARAEKMAAKERQIILDEVDDATYFGSTADWYAIQVSCEEVERAASNLAEFAELFDADDAEKERS